MAKKKKTGVTQAQYDELRRGYKRYVADFDRIILYDGRLHERIREVFDNLREMGVSDHILDQSGMVEILNHPTFSSILKGE